MKSCNIIVKNHVPRWKDDGSALNQLIINSSSINYDVRQEYAQRDTSRFGCNIY